MSVAGWEEQSGGAGSVPAVAVRGRMAPEDRLAARALREGWDVPADRRAALIARLAAIATDPEARARDAVMAAKVLLMASRLTLESIRVSLDVEALERLEGRLARLESSDGPAEPRGPSDEAVRRAREGDWRMSGPERLAVLESLRGADDEFPESPDDDPSAGDGHPAT
jgi:hypothetical protein